VATENVKVAEDALQIARDRRQAGYGSPVEVDRAEDAYRQAHEDLIAAQADAAMAWYSLQHATGGIRSLFGSEDVGRASARPDALKPDGLKPVVREDHR
jgi:outer membrane protein TolC